MDQLVLSLFPGIGLLDRAFEEEGFVVVRGPDVLWGGDIRNFHPPAGKFDGIIGGPPCQCFSPLANLVRAKGYEPRFGNLIPEFERCVAESRPDWFLMENVPGAPVPKITAPKYSVYDFILKNQWLGEPQKRTRRFSFGVFDALGSGPYNLQKHIEVAALELPCLAQSVCSRGSEVMVKLGGTGKVKSTYAHQMGVVTSSDGGGYVRMTRYRLEDACLLQGLPKDFLRDAPFRADAKLKAVANGVPLPMGRAVARAVKKAIGISGEVT